MVDGEGKKPMDYVKEVVHYPVEYEASAVTAYNHRHKILWQDGGQAEQHNDMHFYYVKLEDGCELQASPQNEQMLISDIVEVSEKRRRHNLPPGKH